MKKSDARKPRNSTALMSEPAQATTPPPSETNKPSKKSSRSKRPVGPAKMSGLDAAAKMLAAAGKPTSCADLTKLILGKGLWKTGGKTPAATISAAILREIRDKGKESRFRKAGRGLFVAKSASN